MNETIPLKAEATNEQTPEPKSGAVRRRFGMAAGIVATVACTGALTAFHRSSEEARKQALIEEVHGSSEGHAWDTDDLYSCSLGEPSVPEEYKNNSWGEISGRWYVVAGNVDQDKAAVGECMQMNFNFPTDENDGDDASKYMATEWFNQRMMYTADDDGETNYMWNYTGNLELTDYMGVWKNVDGDGDNDEIYDHFWSSVWAVGEYEGSRWFGWYFCGPAVSSTKKGIPWVLKDSYSYDSGFEEMIKAKFENEDFLADDDDAVVFYNQSSSCDYKWFHTAEDTER